MTYEEFVAADPERTELPVALAALALDRAGRWDAAHERVNDEDSPATQLVHAYLHRKEGDLPNARHWYGRAGVDVPESALEQEWEALVRRFLAES